ncbi:YolD-like family protein [bacterium]|nr:YolD-like family protein [bacterium]
MNNPKYKDIINLPHHVSKNHPRLTIEQRAAQFSPYAALVGYDDAIRETVRSTSSKFTLTEEQTVLLNQKINYLTEHLKDNINVTIKYFIPDTRKEGGHYKKISTTIKSIDPINRSIRLRDDSSLTLDDIMDIDSEVFNSWYV